MSTAKPTAAPLVLSDRMPQQNSPAASSSSSELASPRTPSPQQQPKLSPAKTPKKPKRPKPADLVTAIKDHVGGQYLYNAIDENEYARICRFYHARLSLLVRGLNENELSALFTTNMPSFWGRLDEYGQQRTRKSFDDAYDHAEYHLIVHISELARCWLDSIAGREYTKAVTLHMTKKSAANPMPPRPETVADMEQYKVSDKVGVTEGIILKEQYMIMVWGYALAACESETFAGAALHHWFAGDVARYRALYNALFPITGALVVKFARLIVLNPDEDCQNEALRKVLREVDHPLPIASHLEQAMPPFRDTLQQLPDVLVSLPNWNPDHPPTEVSSIPNSFVTPSQSTSFTREVDALMPALEQQSRDEQYDNLAQLEDNVQVITETFPAHHHLTGNLCSLDAPTLSGPEAERYAMEFAISQWPRRTDLLIAGLLAEQKRLESQARYIYTQIDLISQAKEKVLAAEASRIMINSIMTDAQKKYIAEQQAFAEARAKSNESVLTEIPTSVRPQQRHSRDPKPTDQTRVIKPSSTASAPSRTPFGLGIRNTSFDGSSGEVFSGAGASGVAPPGAGASGVASFGAGASGVASFGAGASGVAPFGARESYVGSGNSGLGSFFGSMRGDYSPSFSPIEPGLHRATQMLPLVGRGNLTPPYSATQVSSLVPAHVRQFNASNPLTACQPTTPSTIRQPPSLVPPTARQPTASSTVRQPYTLDIPTARQPIASSTVRQPYTSDPSTARQPTASALVYATGTLWGETVSQGFASKDNGANSESQAGPRLPFAGGRHPPGGLFQVPPSGSRTPFTVTSPSAPHMTSFPKSTSSPSRDNLPADSYSSTGKRTKDAVVIEDDVEDIEDNEEGGEEEKGEQQRGDEDVEMGTTPGSKV